MFNNSAKIMFSFILMTGTLITVSSNTWLGAWMGLEINLLSFIPLMSDNNLMSTEASLKYFLTQALASAVLLFAIILNFMIKETITENMNMKMMILTSLLLKSGASPFHFWFPNVMEGISWFNGLVLMTWQKIAPLMLISYLTNNSMLLSLTVILSTITGSLGGLNQTSLRKLMAYSSINHLGWMLMALQLSETIWFIYFMFYSFLSATIITIFLNFKLYHINQLFNSFFQSKILKFILLLNLLSLGGLPPFTGFIPKWIIIQPLVMNNQYFMMTLLMTTTLITLFFYIRLCFSAFMLNYYETNWMVKLSINPSITITMLTMTFLSTFGLILISMIYIIL
uniref:NADH dehydrogenase subunit 2 n=1 Tax=Rivellia apicalis TaxID=286529 RepID=UPI0022FD5ADB|nr:NADH dehydrogenase subunit 2 [Rivellia apicalis]WAR64255.1 NADH dehydrogenase subunit 2 [Rivellia apicalis]